MSFLIDTDIGSAYLKNHPRVNMRVMMHDGGLHVSAVTAGELLAWSGRAKAPPRRPQVVRDFLAISHLIVVDEAVAETVGRIRADLLIVDVPDIFNAAVALVHNLAMVTHNVAHYRDVPGLSIVDWMA